MTGASGSAALLEELWDSGVLGLPAIEWARKRQSEIGGSLDAILLELDLIDEEALGQALGNCHGLPVLSRSRVSLADPDLGEKFPLGFSTSFQMCPFELADGELTVLVEAPLPKESADELHELFSLDIIQVLATSHQFALAMEEVYGVEVSPRVRVLEEKLARRRAAPSVSSVLEEIAHAQTLSESTNLLLDFAAHFVEFSCLLVTRGDQLKLAAFRGEGGAANSSLPLPGAQCSIAPALRHGGYFLGPLGQSSDESEFFRALGRDLPRWAIVAPVPVAGESKVMLCADNGSRGIPTRRAAELTLLVSRLAPRSEPPASQPVERKVGTRPPPNLVAKTEAASEASDISAMELAVLAKLHRAATMADQPLEAFVDELLSKHLVAPPERLESAMIGDVRGLLERLATDIPTQLMRGMESAFREMVPRLVIPSTPPAHAPSTSTTLADQSKPAATGIVMTEAKPREVPSYRSRRQKSKKLQL